MYLKKSCLCSIPVGIALALEVAISHSTAAPIMPQYFSVSRLNPRRSPLVPLKKGETKPLLAPLKKGGWGDQTEEYQLTPKIVTELQESQNIPISKLKQALKQTNPPPPPDNPDSSAAGGRRAPSACPQDAVAATTSPLLTALSPITKPGLTLAQPTFLVYVPKTSAKNAEFSLRSRDGRGIYRTTVALTNTPDLISISLPAQVTPLEVGKPYTWSFAVICNPNDRVEDQFVTGTVQRTELDPTRLSQLEQTPPRQRIALYQKDGIWYDALTILFELKRSQPNDPSLNTAWREFLQSGGVDTMIEK